MPHSVRGAAARRTWSRSRSRLVPCLGAALAVAATVLATSPARAQSGVLDPTFGVGGVVKTPFGVEDDFGHAVAIQDDDRIVVAGACKLTTDDFCAVRYTLTGALDTTFGGTGKVSVAVRTEIDQAFGVAIQPVDQRVVLAGFSRQSGVDAFAVARLTATGLPDTTFDGDGKVTTAIGSLEDQARAVAIQSDGKIVVVGYSLTGANRDLALVRYNANGSLDTTFSADGKVALGIGTGDDEAAAVAIQPDGKIVIAGYAADGSQHDMLVARFLANGTLDSSFNGTGSVRITFGAGNEFGNGLAIQSDGKILVAGYARIGTVFNFAIARLTTTGALDPMFDGDGKVTTAIGTTSQANAIAIDANGRFAVAGFARIAGNDDVAIARYNANGSLDGNFGGSGIVTVAPGTSVDEAKGLAVQSDGKVVAAGTTRTGNDDDLTVVRYLVDDCGNGTLDVGEQCDGGAIIDGDCCTSACTLVAANTTCRAVADQCDIVDVCNGVSAACPDVRRPDGDGDGTCNDFDVCPTVPDPGQEDGDDDTLGDACDPCTNGATIAKPKIRMTKFTTGAGDDTFSFTGSMDLAANPVLNPLTKGARLILEDGNGDPLFDVAIPPGAYSPATRTGWTANKPGTIFTFRAKPAIGGVIDKLKISNSTARPDLIKFTASGKKGSFATLPLVQPLHAIVVIDAPTAATGECGEVGFPGPAPAPACAFNGNGSTLTCK